VKSKSKTINKYLEGTQEGEIKVLNPQVEQYKFIFKGKMPQKA